MTDKSYIPRQIKRFYLLFETVIILWRTTACNYQRWCFAIEVFHNLSKTTYEHMNSFYFFQSTGVNNMLALMVFIARI